MRSFVTIERKGNEKINKQAPKPKYWSRYYNDRDILDEITDEPVDLVLDEHLRVDIVSGKRKRKLKNVTIKVDPLQVQAIKKLAPVLSITARPIMAASKSVKCGLPPNSTAI